MSRDGGAASSGDDSGVDFGGGDEADSGERRRGELRGHHGGFVVGSDRWRRGGLQGWGRGGLQPAAARRAHSPNGASLRPEWRNA
ncbi:unnamed protein product, partial [Urochloa humidicola]